MTTVPDHFSRQFTSNVELLLQQRTPYFMGAVNQQSFTGEAAQVVKQFGLVEMQDKTGRFEDTMFSELQHLQRWIFPDDYDLALPIMKEDEIRMLGSLQSPYVEAMRAAYARKWDDIVINAFFATAQTGKNGATTTAFPASQQVAANAGAAAATGLNVEKLIQARQLLVQAEVDLRSEKPYIAVTARQISDLLRTTEVTNADYAGLKRLESGEVDTFMGFRFIRSERLLLNGSNQVRCPVWVPSGIVLGTWNGLETRIGERADKKYITQVYMRATIGATRAQETKVVEIPCA